jgi:hypothetical protein
MKKDPSIAALRSSTRYLTALLGAVLPALLFLAGPAQAQSGNPCLPPPAGLVSWWAAEGTAADIAGTNNGVLVSGAGFAAGAVGQGFSFNGTSQCVSIPYSRTLITTNYTVEAWVEPVAQVSNAINQAVLYGQTYGVCQLLARRGSSGVRIAFQFGTDAYTFYDVVSTVEVPIGQFTHVVGTWDGTSLRLYINGALNAQRTPGTKPVDSGCGFSIGGFNLCGYVGQFFNGLIDETSYYSRALTAAEVQALFTARGAGKCSTPVAPSILSQPASRTVMVGDTAAFTVGAAGSPPLSYQWAFNGVALVGQTSSTLTLDNIQMTQAGSYSVLVTNLAGSTPSSNALLVVNPLPPCVAAPSGLVSWWRAENDALDTVGGNNGTLSNGVGYVSGKVGQAFRFNGTNSYVRVPDSPSLRLTNELTIEFWVKRQDLNANDTLINKGGDYTRGLVDYGVVIPSAQSGTGSTLALTFAGSTRHSTSILDLNWHHVAIVARRGDADPTFYVDGVQQPITLRQGAATVSFYPSTQPLYIGAQVDPNSGWYYFSKALVDEVSIYNRALSAAEIQATYNAQGNGKCHEPPSILTQPASLLANETSDVTFTVAAAGTAPLSYQWCLNGTNLPGATISSLALTRISTVQAGLYSVRITNLFGAVISSNAVLTVNQLPLALCANLVVPASANCTAEGSVNNGSYDPDDDPITVRQVPPGPFPLGTNLVSLVVTDNHGASNSCSALVIVQDQTPPVLACPQPMVLEFQDESGALAAFVVTAIDNCSPVSLTVNPASGSRFPIGVTAVAAQALDAASNSARCSFTVTVLGAQGVKSNILAELRALRAGTPMTAEFAQKFDDAIQHLATSLTPAYWIDQTHLQLKLGNVAMNEEKLAAGKLQEILSSSKCPVNPARLQGLIDRIVQCDRLLAIVCIREAAADGLNPKKVAEDLDLVAKGDREAAAGRYASAIEHYRNAWRHALQLRLHIGVNADGTTRVQFVGNNSQSYRVEVSADMATWVSLGTFKADADGNVEFTDPNSANRPLRFYRAVEQ